MQINSNFINLNKSTPKSGLNLKTDESDLKSEESQNSDKSAILHDASNLVSETNNESESSADVIKKQLEKLQKQLKEIEAAIKQASASKKSIRKRASCFSPDQKGNYLCSDNAAKRPACKDARRLNSSNLTLNLTSRGLYAVKFHHSIVN